MSVQSTLTYKDGLAFDVELGGHHFTLDASPQYGGRDLGPKPMPLLLSALGGCSGMDVVSILTKMKIPAYTLSIEVEGEPTGEQPNSYRTIEVRYLFTGQELPIDKLRHAIELSMTRYCGVKYMLSKASDITWTLIINGEKVS